MLYTISTHSLAKFVDLTFTLVLFIEAKALFIQRIIHTTIIAKTEQTMIVSTNVNAFFFHFSLYII
jgi:hypothetical protein